MIWLRAVWAELFSLFVDDGRLALAILAWVAVAWLVLPRLLPAGWDAIGLAIGLAAILVGSTAVWFRR